MLRQLKAYKGNIAKHKKGLLECPLQFLFSMTSLL